MSSSSRTGLLAALALVILGAVALLALRDDPATAGAPSVAEPVLVTSRTIPAGTTVAAILADPDEWVEQIEVPADTVLTDAFRSLEELAASDGQVVYEQVRSGAQMRSRSLLTPGQQLTGAIPAPEDTFEFTIEMLPENAVGAAIRPGHRVAVIASFRATNNRRQRTSMVAHDVLVTNVELGEVSPTFDNAAPDPLRPGVAVQTSVFVTLSVSLEDLEQLILVEEFAVDYTLAQHVPGAPLPDDDEAVNMFDVLGLVEPPINDPGDVDYSTFTPSELQSANPDLVASLEDDGGAAAGDAAAPDAPDEDEVDADEEAEPADPNADADDQDPPVAGRLETGTPFGGSSSSAETGEPALPTDDTTPAE